jgi:hypothetical protein
MFLTRRLTLRKGKKFEIRKTEIGSASHDYPLNNKSYPHSRRLSWPCAFGGAKQVAYNNGRTLSLGYHNRMRVTDWTVPSVLGWQYSYTDVGENTGRVMFTRNTASSTAAGLRDDTLDRSYDYDHVGRLIVSHSGLRSAAAYEPPAAG